MTDWSERVTLSHEKLKFLPKNQNWLEFRFIFRRSTPLSPLKIPSEHQTSASWTHKLTKQHIKLWQTNRKWSLYHMKSWNFSQRTKTGLVSFHFPMLTSPPPYLAQSHLHSLVPPRRVMKSFPIMGQTKGTSFFLLPVFITKNFLILPKIFWFLPSVMSLATFPWRLPVQCDRWQKSKNFRQN